ncbi:MAG: hypothetical protein H8E37_03950 [Planctomycetes bacterium]|nr:hypothetical protein [Planctomycetota bacterium]
MRAPRQATSGTAKATLSFTDFPEADPATIEFKVPSPAVDPRSMPVK